MTFSMLGRSITKIGVVGSGQIGPDIALYFSKVLAPQGVAVVVNDVAQAALDAGAAKTRKKIDKGVESGAFKPAEAEAMWKNIAWSADKKALAGCELIVEAATERLEIKQSIVADLEAIAGPGAIIASNSSHLEPEVIFAKAQRPDRGLVIHYFFPAERNLLVEVVPGAKTSPAIADFCMQFYEAIGKVPIRVGSRYGYAIDPIFEGIFLAALKIADEGIATPKEIDAVAQKVLGLGVGPFTAMNLTGGNPITQVGLRHYHEKIMPWFESPTSLDDMVAKKGLWETAGRGETVTVDDAKAAKVGDLLLGATFGLALEILESGITNLGDLDMAVELGLAMKAPFTLMNRTPRAAELVKAYAAKHPGFKAVKTVEQPWKIPFVFRQDPSTPAAEAAVAQGKSPAKVAVVVIKRPRVLNALSLEVYAQLREQFEEIKRGPYVGAVLTGFGTKAFVSGADIGMLATVKGPEQGESTSRQSHEVQNFIENLGKPVVCALNGLSLGGGSELAYACSARIARKGIRQLFGQPEVKLGIIPGAGGSVRLPRLIDFAAASRILRTGGTISGAEAKQWGLIVEEVEGDLLGRAVALAKDLASGRAKAPALPRQPVTGALPDVDLGGLSKKVDEILVRSIRANLSMPLDQALANEAKLFGEVCGTKDMKIGMENFIKTGLKEPAKFVHA